MSNKVLQARISDGAKFSAGFVTVSGIHVGGDVGRFSAVQSFGLVDLAWFEITLA